MKIGRNDPCPCRSGKKYKQCCIQRTVDNGPCEALAPSRDGVVCTWKTDGRVVACTLCGHQYRHCALHRAEASHRLSEHVVLAHPEAVSKGHFEQLISDSAQLAKLREHAAASPELYGRLLAYVESQIATRNASR